MKVRQALGAVSDRLAVQYEISRELAQGRCDGNELGGLARSPPGRAPAAGREGARAALTAEDCGARLPQLRRGRRAEGPGAIKKPRRGRPRAARPQPARDAGFKRPATFRGRFS
jgi:hypothetical protein